MRRTLTVRRKFVLALAAVALMVAGLVGALGYSSTQHVLEDEIDRSLVSAAATLSDGGTVASVLTEQAIAGRSDGGPADGGSGATDGDGLRQQGIVQSAQTMTAAGAVTLITGVQLPVNGDIFELAQASAGTQRLRTLTVDDTDYRVLAVALGDERGVIQVARDLAVTQDVLSELAWNTVLIALGVLVLAALAGWLIARQITHRLTALTSAAEQIGVTGRWELQEQPRGGHDEVGRLGTAIQAMLAELARSREDQQRLVQDAGHELRTPLTSLRTNISVLRRYDELPPGSRVRLLDDVQSEARELTDLVNELVELATDRHNEEAAEEFDLATAVHRVAGVYRRRSRREITVTTPRPVLVCARRHSVERAVSNLLENAVKFDPTGTRPIEIGVIVSDVGVAVAVSDRGPGLAAGDSARIFDRFYRSDTARSRPGSGLGLAIVRDVAVSHGGTVSAADRPGGGASIVFTLGRAALLPNDNPEAGRL